MGEVIADPYLIDNVLYLWIKDKGLVAFDLKKRKVNWVFNEIEHRQMYFELVVENDTIFVYSSTLFALSRFNGQVLWRNETLQSRESFILGSTNNEILVYKSLDDDIILVACDKKTGEIVYESFRGYDLKKRTLSHLEHVAFRFADKMYKNLLFAVDVRRNIYCFEVKE